MALNYSQRPVLPSHTSENRVSPMRIVNGYVEGVPETRRECFSFPWHGSSSSQGEADIWRFGYGGRDDVDRGNSQDLTSKDIVDLLPSDPFGMDIETTFTAITGWLEDLEVDYAERMKRANQDNYSLFAGWNFIWNSSLMFQPFPNYVELPGKRNVENRNVCFPINVTSDGELNANANTGVEFQQAGDVVGFGNGSSCGNSGLQIMEKTDEVSGSEGDFHEGLGFALGYLGVKDLLSVERVCKSLCSTVQEDPLLWMNIHIDQPLNEKVTDDVLVKLANRAQGNLQCLSLVECPKVTDDGLRRVLKSNFRLTKLCVPGCTRLTIEGILNNVKTYNSSKDVKGIKHLRIGGLYGWTQEHYEQLKLLLDADRYNIESQHKPHFYHRGNFYLPHDDDRVLDIEMCPLCEKFRLVYDCPAESCREKDKAAVKCRACTLCIPRCAQCGRCVNDTEYEETFCLELLCSGCFKQFPKYQSKVDMKGDDVCGGLHEPSYSLNQHG